jgi:hypothetical protein
MHDIPRIVGKGACGTSSIPGPVDFRASITDRPERHRVDRDRDVVSSIQEMKLWSRATGLGAFSNAYRAVSIVPKSVAQAGPYSLFVEPALQAELGDVTKVLARRDHCAHYRQHDAC